MTRIMSSATSEGSGAGGAAVAPAHSISAETVGRAFVTQYFTVLHGQPEHVYKFYTDESKMTRTEGGLTHTVTTQKGIDQKVMSLNSREFTAKIKSIDSQDSLMSSVLVMVTGYIIRKDFEEGSVQRNFVQSFVLAPQERGGYFVLNDTFRYCDDEVEGGAHDVAATRAPVLSSEEVGEQLAAPPPPPPPPPSQSVVMANGIHEEAPAAAPHREEEVVEIPFEPLPSHGIVQLNEVEEDIPAPEQQQHVAEEVPSSFGAPAPAPPNPVEAPTEETTTAGEVADEQETVNAFEEEGTADAPSESHHYVALPPAPAPPTKKDSPVTEIGDPLLSLPAVSAGEAVGAAEVQAGGASAEAAAVAPAAAVPEASGEPEKPKKFSYASAVLKPRAAPAPAPPPAAAQAPPSHSRDSGRLGAPASPLSHTSAAPPGRLAGANGTSPPHFSGALSAAPSGDFSDKSAEEAGGAVAPDAEGRRRGSAGQAQAPLPSGGQEHNAEGAALGGAAGPPAAAAPVEQPETDGRSIYVRGLPANITEDELVEAFKHFGKVANVQVRMGRVPNYSSGMRADTWFGFVEFVDATSAQAAVEKNSIPLGANIVRIEKKVGGGRSNRPGGAGGPGPRNDRGGPFRPRDNRDSRGGRGGLGGGYGSGRGGGRSDQQQAGQGGGAGAPYRTGGGSGGRGQFAGGNSSGGQPIRPAGAAPAAGGAAAAGPGSVPNAAGAGSANVSGGNNNRSAPRRTGGPSGGGGYYGGGRGPGEGGRGSAGGGGAAWGPPAPAPVAAVAAE